MSFRQWGLQNLGVFQPIWTSDLGCLSANGEHQAFIFDQTITNSGRFYYDTTGILTAPQAGIYVFHVSVMVNGGDEMFHVSVMVNDGDEWSTCQ